MITPLRTLPHPATMSKRLRNHWHVGVERKNKGGMRYRQLGRSGLCVSAINLGSNGFGRQCRWAPLVSTQPYFKSAAPQGRTRLAAGASRGKQHHCRRDTAGAGRGEGHRGEGLLATWRKLRHCSPQWGDSQA